MTTMPWEPYLSERDRRVAAAVPQREAGFPSKPAILIIDATYAFCGDRPEPLEISTKRWPGSCGQEAWDALGQIQKLLKVARAKKLPIFFTTNDWREDKWDMGGWHWKVGGQVITSAAVEAAATPAASGPREVLPDPHAVIAELGLREDTEILIKKKKPSGFFGTTLYSDLTFLGADGVIVCGFSTSGCVRASVVDAFNNNFRVVVAEDCCADRYQASHAITLFDIGAKYVDIAKCSAVCRKIEALPELNFHLPRKK
jgi:maleamate amidohydrolase